MFEVKANFKQKKATYSVKIYIYKKKTGFTRNAWNIVTDIWFKGTCLLVRGYPTV